MTAPGVGLDLVAVSRFAAVLARRPRLADRLFTVTELIEAGGRTERLAARFAAKEAVLKALGVGLGAGRWHDLEVRRTPSGAPLLTVAGRFAVLAAEAGFTHFDVSLSHDGDVAGAVVIGRGA